MEVELADIWADVFRLDRVGIHDVFFDPGGHSLPASQVVSRAITAFRVEVAAQVAIRIAHGGADGPVMTENRAKKADHAEVAARLRSWKRSRKSRRGCFQHREPVSEWAGGCPISLPVPTSPQTY